MGNNDYGQLGTGDFNSSPLPVKVINNGVSDIACGRESTLVLMNDGSLKAFGSSEFGQLGIDRPFYRLTPYQLPHKLLPE